MPAGTMRTVARLRCRIGPWDWPFVREEAARIDSHWAALQAAKPRLFNGRVLMGRDLSVEDVGGGVLHGAAHEVDYKAFLAWRDFGFPGVPVHNVFAMPALRAVDGPFLLGRMSAGTANAGKLYFPAGTPDPSDAGADGCIDFDASILRELHEETGIRADEIEGAAAWTLVCAGPLVACMKVVQSPLTAGELQTRVAAFIATQADAELDGLVAVAREEDFDPVRMPSFMLTYLRAALAES